jgi:hypothetical protein
MSTMERNREKNEKLLSLISEIRQLVGDFDASSILEKFQSDQNCNYDSCLESDNGLTFCDRDHSQKVMTLKQPPVWKGKHSPDAKRGAPSPFSPAAVRSVTTLRNYDFKLNEVDKEDGLSITPNPTSQQNDDEQYYYDGSNEQRPSSVITPQSHQQRRRRLSSSRYALPQSSNRAAAETMEKRNCPSLKKSSIPSERLYGTSIPALDINTFMEELPSNSPVRTLISNCIASVSPSRRTSDYIEDRRSSLQRDEISPKKARNTAEKLNNFLELVCIGANRESLEGSSFLAGSSEAEQLSNLNSLQRGKVDILDHFKLGECEKGFTCRIESITDYCFPDGVVIDVVLKTDIVKYAGSKNDAMHVMQFSDATGSPTYACCLTVTEHVEPKNKDIIRSLLLQKRSYAKAVGIIIKAFRRLLRKRKDLLLNLSKNIAGSEHSIFDRKLSFYSMSTPFKFGSTKVSADVDDSEVKQTGVGFGSAIMSRLKMGISFAGGRTTEKPIVAKTPSRKTNKVLWSDLDDDEVEESRGPDGVLRAKEGGKMKFAAVRGINEEDEYDGDEEGADVEEEGDRDTSGDSYRGSRGVFSPAVSLTPDANNSPHAPSTSPYTTEGTPRGSAPLYHTFDTSSIMSMISSGMDVFSPARRSPIHEPPVDVPSAHRLPERGSAVTDKGHSVTELEGLHMHGFSSESEGDDDAETDELESSFESDVVVKNKRRSSKEKSNKKKNIYLEDETNCHTPGTSPPLRNVARRSSAESDDLHDSIDKSTEYRGSKLSPGSIADSSISERDIYTVCSTEKEGNEEDRMGLDGEVEACKGPIVEPENVDEYLLVTKKAYCILSITPLHSFAFAVSTCCTVLLRTDLHPISLWCPVASCIEHLYTVLFNSHTLCCTITPALRCHTVLARTLVHYRTLYCTQTICNDNSINHPFCRS